LNAPKFEDLDKMRMDLAKALCLSAISSRYPIDQILLTQQHLRDYSVVFFSSQNFQAFLFEIDQPVSYLSFEHKIEGMKNREVFTQINTAQAGRTILL
jgi:hypothetical protein